MKRRRGGAGVVGVGLKPDLQPNSEPPFTTLGGHHPLGGHQSAVIVYGAAVIVY